MKQIFLCTVLAMYIQRLKYISHLIHEKTKPMCMLHPQYIMAGMVIPLPTVFHKKTESMSPLFQLNN